MPQNPRHIGSFTFIDRSKESSTMTFDFDAVTAVSIPGFLTDFGTFRTATQAISLGALTRDRWTGDSTAYSAVIPTAQDALRETKYLFLYEDTVTFTKGKIEVPVADLSLTNLYLAGTTTDEIDLSQTQIAAWVTAFEQLCRTPDGNTLTVTQGFVVGRNL